MARRPPREGAVAAEGNSLHCMATTLRYRVVDVFTQTALEGNPLAVFYEERDLAPELMLRIARELNLSETCFLMPATRGDCALRVRIFTPARELLFAGHPTIGAAYVALECNLAAGERQSFAFEEGVGPVAVTVEGPVIWLSTPPIERIGQCDRAACARALDLREWDLLADVPPEIYSAGNPMLFVAVNDPATVDGACVDSQVLRALEEQIGQNVGLFVFAPTVAGAYSRMFAPELGVVEDPATGSATGPLAAYMMAHGLCSTAGGTTLTSEQGTKIGRRSLLSVRIRGEKGCEGIDVGGHVTPVIDAILTLP
ncbi:MAG: PhzF family phenazine biosynthesis protein [Candidatus Tyrphobacter sp.]